MSNSVSSAGFVIRGLGLVIPWSLVGHWTLVIQPGEHMTSARADPKTHATSGQTLRIDPDNMMVRAVISTNTPDRAGDMMIPAGLRNADEFLRNPVVLWAHQRSLPPIGTCERLTIEPERIIAETKFAASSPFARDVFTLYAEGVLRGWSVGFV